MDFASSPELRADVLSACRILTFFRIVEGFGHVSTRIPETDRILITPRRALGLVGEEELVDPVSLPVPEARRSKFRCILPCTAAARTSRRLLAAIPATWRPMLVPARR